MKTARKVLLLVLCAALLVSASVMGTIAYLTSTTDVVNNTFTVGNVAITLDEADVNVYGEPLKSGEVVEDVKTADRVIKNEYKLVANHTYTKDPTVHVAEGSEDCWLFVQVVNGLGAAETNTANSTIAAQMTANGWSLVSGTTNVYAYKETVSAKEDVVVFGTFTTSTDVANTTTVQPITIQAYAIQADGFETAAAAWTAAPATWGAAA